MYWQSSINKTHAPKPEDIQNMIKKINKTNNINSMTKCTNIVQLKITCNIKKYDS